MNKLCTQSRLDCVCVNTRSLTITILSLYTNAHTDFLVTLNGTSSASVCNDKVSYDSSINSLVVTDNTQHIWEVLCILYLHELGMEAAALPWLTLQALEVVIPIVLGGCSCSMQILLVSSVIYTALVTVLHSSWHSLLPKESDLIANSSQPNSPPQGLHTHTANPFHDCYMCCIMLGLSTCTLVGLSPLHCV